MAQDLAAIPIAMQLVSAAFLFLVLASPLALAPIAALLVHKGADPSVALALTLPAILVPMAERLHLRAPAPRLGGLVGAVGIAGMSYILPALHVPVLGGLRIPDLHATVAHHHGVIEYTCAATIAGLYLAALLRSGLHGFVHTLESAPG